MTRHISLSGGRAARRVPFSLSDYVREHRYVLLVLYLPVYLIWFFLQERVIASPSQCWVSWLPADDAIPFIPQFIYAYVTWYPYLLIPAVVFLLREDGAAFTRYALFIIIGFSASLLICAIWPNCQLLRPDAVDTKTLSGVLVSAIYAADTPTNVLPSMHVVGCIGVIAACFDRPYLRKWRGAMVVWGVLISASTVFVKQHSLLDVYAGLALGLVLTALLYGVLKKHSLTHV